jgi:hypothetical protein
MLPEETAVVHVLGHQGITPRRLMETVWLIRLWRRLPSIWNCKCYISPLIQASSVNPGFTPLERVQLEKLGASQTPEGKWLLPYGREVLSKPLMREVMTQLHCGSHWGIQGMCDASLKAYVCPGIYTLAKQVIKNCLTCWKVNKQALKGQILGGSPGLRLFQSIQVDYTELPQVGHLKYLLVIVDHLTNWFEAIYLYQVPLQKEWLRYFWMT